MATLSVLLLWSSDNQACFGGGLKGMVSRKLCSRGPKMLVKVAYLLICSFFWHYVVCTSNDLGTDVSVRLYYCSLFIDTQTGA